MTEKNLAANLEKMSKLSYDAVEDEQPDKNHRPNFRSPYNTERLLRSEDTLLGTLNDGSGQLTADTSATTSSDNKILESRDRRKKQKKKGLACLLI